MKWLMLILPYILASFVAKVLVYLLIGYPAPVKIIGIALPAYGLFYFNNWYWLREFRDRMESVSYEKLLALQARLKDDEGRRMPAAHLMFFAAGALMGCGLAYASYWPVAAAILPWWKGDDWMTSARKRRMIEAKVEANKPSPQVEKLMFADKVRRLQKDDPLAMIRISAKVVADIVVDEQLKAGKPGITGLLCAIGALAGYACQASIRGIATEAGLAENEGFIKVETKDGKVWFFGDPLNDMLLSGEHSLLALATAAARAGGYEGALDVEEIFARAASTVGGREFGVPRVPPQYMPPEMPQHYLERLWSKVQSSGNAFASARGLSVVFAMAAEEAIRRSHGKVPADVALRLVLESAIPMSKLDLRSDAAAAVA